MGRKLGNHNPPAADRGDSNDPADIVKRDFGIRLEALYTEKGWNQSELARHAEKHLPAGKRFNRDNISNYVKGRHLPQPLHLKAICKALGVAPNDLLPPGSTPSADDRAPPLRIEEVGGDVAFLRINKRVPMEKAMRIFAIMVEE